MSLLSELKSATRLHPSRAVLIVGGQVVDWTQYSEAFGSGACFVVSGAAEGEAWVNAEGQETPVVFHQVLADSSGETTWYTASNRNESGLVRPEAMQRYWRNIRTVEQDVRPTQTVAGFIDAMSGEQPGLNDINWLVVDCSGAAHVLAGAGDSMTRLDGVVVRAFFDEGADSELSSSSAASISHLLSPLGFEIVSSVPGRHESVGHLIMVRNWKRVLREELASCQANLVSLEQKQSDDLAALKAAQGELIARCDGLKAENTRLTEELQAQSELLVQARAANEELTAQLGELRSAQSELAARRDSLKAENTRLTEELHAQSEHLSQARMSNEELSVQLAELKRSDDHNRRTLSAIHEDVRDARQLSLAALRGERHDLVRLLINKADAEFTAGSFKAAAEHYELAGDLAPESAWAVQGMAESIARLDFKADVHWFCQDTAAAIQDDGKWDVAVRMYRDALKLDPEIGRNFNAKLPTRAAEPGKDPAADPVFVVGCGHSGTSIMLRILGNHPKLMPIPKETAMFLRTDKVIATQMAEWDTQCAEQGCTRWVEKTPPHIFQIGRFLGLRPNSQFVLMLRDGRDVVSSLRHRKGYEDVADRIDRWVYDNAAGMPFWDHPQVKVVKYEEFVENPGGVVADICAFLGLDAGDGIFSYHKDEAHWYSKRDDRPDVIETHDDHMALRNWQINQPVFDGRGKWKDDMPDSERAAFKTSEAQQLLVKLGYETGTDW